MKKQKIYDTIYCAERGQGTGAHYLKKGIGLRIFNHSDANMGYFDGWELAIAPDTIYTGITKESLIAKFKELWPELTWHTENSRDKICVYTDNLDKVKGFFESYITEEFEGFYCILNDFYEVRPCERWMEIDKAKEDTMYIATQAQQIIDEYFVPGKYFYISPQQRNRKSLAKSKKAANNFVADAIYPSTYDVYKRERKGYFAGLLYYPYTGIIEEPMMVLDITSSYIFDLLIEKHVCSAKRRVKDLDMWQYYLSSATKASFGIYTIKYAMPTNHITCFTDANGEKLQPGEHTVRMHLTNVDLNNLLSLGYIKEVICEVLYEYDVDYLPEYVRESIIDAYIKKTEAKSKAEKAIRKPILNGYYGDTIRRYDTEDEFQESRNNIVMCPMWGIFTTSYSKKWLLGLALQMDGWYYSDTDSIICKDTKENRQKLEEFNAKIRDMIAEWCDKFGYDYNIMKDLGTFKVEAEITKMRVWKTKTYCYKTVTGEIILKAAGLVKNSIELNEKLFYTKELDYTRSSFPLIVPAAVSKTGEGYYVEFTPENKMQYYLSMNLIRESKKDLNKRA